MSEGRKKGKEGEGREEEGTGGKGREEEGRGRDLRGR